MYKEPLFWWMSPRKEKNQQWYWGYQKVRMIVLKDKPLNKANSTKVEK